MCLSESQSLFIQGWGTTKNNKKIPFNDSLNPFSFRAGVLHILTIMIKILLSLNPFSFRAGVLRSTKFNN